MLTHKQQSETVVFTYKENGAKVLRANLIYTLNGGQEYEEWFRKPAKLTEGMKVSARLPKGTTHYFINLIDENKFLRSYPEVERKNPKDKISQSALAASGQTDCSYSN